MMLQPILAAAAARERDSRERGFPKLIAAGKISAEDAQAQLTAWRAIAEIFERGSTERTVTWSELHLATSRCLIALEADVERLSAPRVRGEGDREAVEGAPSGGDPDRLRKLTRRRDMVAALHARIEHQKMMIDDTNEILRARAERERQAA